MISRSIALIAPLLLLGATVRADTKGCSQATLKGTYAILEQGMVIAQLPGLPAPPFPVVLSGTATFDGAGNITAAAFTANFDGIAMPGTATGTYLVDPDCTYTDQINDSSGVAGHHSGVIIGLKMSPRVQYIYTDPWLVASGTLKRVWPVRCSLATLKGTFGILEQGTVVAQIPGFPPAQTPFPGVSSGTVTYDGAGNFSVSGTANFDGMAIPMAGSGTYSVNRDCTYSDSGSVPNGPTFHHAGVISGPGFPQLSYIYTDSWAVTTGAIEIAQ